jgi:dTMP kinase
MATLRRGIFIVFEGIDRCGKTTQAIKLVEFMKQNNLPCEHLRFPDRTTPIGKLIDEYLRNKVQMHDRMIHLLFAANRWESQPKLAEYLWSGRHVICDRYAYSGVAFSAAKGLSIEWCKNADEGLIGPDMIFYLDLPVEVALKRGQFGTERYETEAFQRRVQDVYTRLKDKHWHIIDASQPAELIQQQIQKLVIPAIDTFSRQPTHILWNNTM